MKKYLGQESNLELGIDLYNFIIIYCIPLIIEFLKHHISPKRLHDFKIDEHDKHYLKKLILTIVIKNTLIDQLS